MNVIHVEEYDFFKRNIGMTFLYESGVITPENLVELEMLIGEK